MRIKVWGARGSMPVSGPAHARFGHHTVMVAVEAAGETLVLDCGSGATLLAEHLAMRAPARVHVLLSHYHHDHVMGLPFFLLGLSPRTEVVVHCALPGAATPRRVLSRLFSPPYFPLPVTKTFARARFRHHDAGAGFRVGAVEIGSALLDHPGGSMAYRISAGGRSLVYASDLEHAATPDPALAALARGGDLLIHDTMFTLDEAARHRGWGHSTPEAAAALARRAGIGRVLGFHHNPEHDDAMLDRHEAHFAALLPGSGLAREGMEIAV